MSETIILNGYTTALEYLTANAMDYVYWRADMELEAAGTDPARKAEAFRVVAELISTIPDGIRRGYYMDGLRKKFAVTKKQFADKVMEMIVDGNDGPIDTTEVKIPDGVDAEEAYRAGFFELHNSYHFINNQGTFEGSNFIIKPLFHIYSKSDNKRLIEIVNRFGRKRVVDVPTKSFVSVEQFQAIAAGEGNYLFYGNKQQFFKVLTKVMEEMPICEELKTLGWQREGFLAFANGAFSGDTYTEVDEMGMMEHNEKKYFSPAYSMVYKDVREDDDEYETDRFFIYQKSPISFEEWAKLMDQVYSLHDNGKIAIAFLIACCFRDLIYSKYKVFPHLFLFGKTQSGKSQLGWSLSNFFFNNMPPFNLNSGTFVGFNRKLARFRNTVSWFDEYSNEIEERRLQQLKSAYDGVGHEKGKMTTDNRTTTTPVNAGCVISGQYLPTRDDNALFNRSILLEFEDQKFSQQQIDAYTQLKDYELEGLSSILCELLKYRKTLEKNFTMEFDNVYKELKNHPSLVDDNIDERLIRNFSIILTPIKILTATDISLPFTYNTLLLQAVTKISNLSGMISSSQSLAVFWDMVMYLLDNHLIASGLDFKIETKFKGQQQPIIQSFVQGRANKDIMEFKRDTQVLYINLSRILPLYLENHRKQHGTKGLDKNSLIYYLKASKAYIGHAHPVRFENTATSAYLFDHSLLQSTGVNLERISGSVIPDDTVFQDDNKTPF
jgi:DNA primase